MRLAKAVESKPSTYDVNDLKSSGSRDPFTSVYCSIDPIRLTSH